VRIYQVLEKLSGLPRIRSSGGRKLKSRETVSKIGREKKGREADSCPPTPPPILFFVFFPGIGNSRPVATTPILDDVLDGVLLGKGDEGKGTRFSCPDGADRVIPHLRLNSRKLANNTHRCVFFQRTFFLRMKKRSIPRIF